ncbi:MAG: hypothetical protein WC389_03615 [Lutibacter sp.]|jgi:hypothetical protein
MGGCFGNSPEDIHFENQLFRYLDEKSYCEIHDIYYDESKSENGYCPICEKEKELSKK